MQWPGDGGKDCPVRSSGLEITDRGDLGVDLNAPAERETGGQYWSYALVREVRESDIVLHYRARPINAITHWSRAVGEAYTDAVFWARTARPAGGGRSAHTGVTAGASGWTAPMSCPSWSPVRTAIAAERQPTDPTWAELCAELDVALVWPDTFPSLFDGTSWPSGVVGDA
jgi:hypothetical protein